MWPDDTPSAIWRVFALLSLTALTIHWTKKGIAPRAAAGTSNSTVARPQLGDSYGRVLRSSLLPLLILFAAATSRVLVFTIPIWSEWAVRPWSISLN